LRRFEKQKPGGRIDLAVALAMAVGAAVAGQRPTSGYITGRLVAA